MDFNEKLKGTIFDIQGFSVHDGPGCRTLIFFKGCPLCCDWCSNPEGIKPYPEPLYNISKCISDGLCIKSCPYKAITSETEGISINYDLCRTCFNKDCAKSCDTGALKIAGYEIIIKDLYNKIERDRKFWGKDGGITLTGGEPLMQPEFATELLKICYNAYIHTAIETCGNLPWTNYTAALSFIDWIFYDIKHTDPAKHKERTTSSNNLIIQNLEKLVSEYKGRLILRMPVIHEYNDSEQHIFSVIQLMKKNKLNEINILPLHNWGMEKYTLLGREHKYNSLEIPDAQTMQHIKEIFTNENIICYSASETPF